MHPSIRRTLIVSASLLALGLAGASPAPAATLRFAAQADLGSLEPHGVDETFTSGLLGNVYEGLVRRGTDLAIQPALADSFEMVEPTRWRFHLRKGVTFHDGTPLSADDVLFSAQRIAAPGSDFKNRLAADTRVIKIDDATVDFVTAMPNPIIHYQWGNWYIVSKSWAEKHDALQPKIGGAGQESYTALHENGTGPYVITERVPGTRTIFAENPKWWGQATRRDDVSQVVFTPIPNDATRVAALISGQLDLAFAIPVQDVDRVERTPATAMLIGPELRTIYLFLDQFRDELIYSDVKGKNPLKDRRVREALYRAIDIEAIKTKVMRNMATPTALMVAPGINGFSSDFKRLDYDPAKAKALLGEAGYPEGFALTIDCPNNRYVNDEAICVAVANMWARIGVKTAVNARPSAQFFKKVLAPELDFSVGLIGSTPPSFDSWAPINSLHQCPRLTPTSPVWAEADRDKIVDGKSNYGGYCNPKVDALADRILQEADKAKRNALIHEVWTITTDDIAYLPLHQQALAWGIRKGLKVEQRADGVLDFTGVVVGK